LEACETTFICSEIADGHPIQFSPDTTNPDYYNNWYIQMGFICTSPAIVGLLFTAERFSEAFSGWKMIGRTDALGRKNGLLIFVGTNLIA